MQTSSINHDFIRKKVYVLDSNVLIHDPSALFNFEEHAIVIPMTVLEELDKLKTGKKAIASECRQVIRNIDRILGDADSIKIQQGVTIKQDDSDQPSGTLSILMHQLTNHKPPLYINNNDNVILNDIYQYQRNHSHLNVILVSKDINMRLKAKGCGINAEDYHNDQLLSDIDLLSNGYIHFKNSFWDNIDDVRTHQDAGLTFHKIDKSLIEEPVYINQFFIDDAGFIGRVNKVDNQTIELIHINQKSLMQQSIWGLKPLDIYQAIALNLLMDPDIHLVNLSGSAGSGKTILALAAAIEMTTTTKQYNRIIATRSIKGLDEEIGFLPGTEFEKMEPWLGAITDNLEALHNQDESTQSSIEYVLKTIPLQFKSLNYIRGRSFQKSLLIIDECQNLTPHQIKTIVTRAGNGSKVICLGNLAQIDTPYLSPTSSGLTYLTERLKNFTHSGSVHLKGVPRSKLAAYAEQNL